MRNLLDNLGGTPAAVLAAGVATLLVALEHGRVSGTLAPARVSRWSKPLAAVAVALVLVALARPLVAA